MSCEIRRAARQRSFGRRRALIRVGLLALQSATPASVNTARRSGRYRAVCSASAEATTAITARHGADRRQRGRNRRQRCKPADIGDAELDHGRIAQQQPVIIGRIRPRWRSRSRGPRATPAGIRSRSARPPRHRWQVDRKLLGEDRADRKTEGTAQRQQDSRQL